MNRPLRLLLLSLTAVSVAIGAAACGTQKIHVPSSDPTYSAEYKAAVLFNQRCGGCHTLSYAGTHGSASNVRTAENINGPNFNVRCERPASRVLYAIANGGFEGAYMPQNVVVGQQAREVALFVSKFAGREAGTEPAPGVVPCRLQPIGTLPSAPGAVAVSAPSTPAPTTSSGNTLRISASKTMLMFNAKTLTVSKPGKVTIVFTNPSPIPHNLTVQEGTNGKVLGHTPTFPTGQHVLVLNLPAGTYTFFCSVAGHRAAGMVGTLTVK